MQLRTSRARAVVKASMQQLTSMVNDAQPALMITSRSYSTAVVKPTARGSREGASDGKLQRGMNIAFAPIRGVNSVLNK